MATLPLWESCRHIITINNNNNNETIMTTRHHGNCCHPWKNCSILTRLPAHIIHVNCHSSVSRVCGCIITMPVMALMTCPWKCWSCRASFNATWSWRRDAILHGHGIVVMYQQHNNNRLSRHNHHDDNHRNRIKAIKTNTSQKERK